MTGGCSLQHQQQQLWHSVRRQDEDKDEDAPAAAIHGATEHQTRPTAVTSMVLSLTVAACTAAETGEWRQNIRTMRQPRLHYFHGVSRLPLVACEH